MRSDLPVRALGVPGAHVFTLEVHDDERGTFSSPYQESVFERAVGHRLTLAQTNITRSHRDVVRGVHFTATPPGCAKYVHCVRGRALDIVVDLRVGSPAFGTWDAVELDETRQRAVYLPVGVGHAVVALADETVMSYVVTTGYVPANELTVSVFDPALALPLPTGSAVVLSERDRRAPTVDQAGADGLLPDYGACTGVR